MDKDNIKEIKNELLNERIKDFYGNEILISNNTIDNSYNYGLNQPKLDANKSIRNLPTTSVPQFKIGTFTISGTGNISVTGVGFKPKLVKFNICNSSGNIANAGVGSMTETEQQCLNIYLSLQTTANCIYFSNSGGVVARAVYVSMDNDGFTINCTYFAGISYVTYECYA